MSFELRDFIMYTIFQFLSVTKLAQLYLYFGQKEGKSTPIQAVIARLIRKKSIYVNIPHRLPYGDLVEVFSKGDIQHIRFTFKNEYPIFWPFWNYETIPMENVIIKDSVEPIRVNQETVKQLLIEDISSFHAFAEYLGGFINLKTLKIQYSEFDFEKGDFIKAKLEKLKIKQCWIFNSEDALIELIKSQAKSLKELYIKNRYPDDVVNSLKDTIFPKLENLTIFFKSPVKQSEFGRLNSFPHVKYLCAIVERASDGLELIYQILKNCKMEAIIIEIKDEVEIDQNVIQKIAQQKAKQNFTKYIYIRLSKYTYIARI